MFTAELSYYSDHAKEGYIHNVICHRVKEHAISDVITDPIEVFGPYFKRCIFCTYHFVSKLYLQRCIDEAECRYNAREADNSARFADIFTKAIGVVSYADVKMAT